MTRKRASAHNFVPSLESLDGRIVPSCTWVEADGVLTITGDAGANVVEITDDGTTLTITCDGETVDASADVTDVVLRVKAGDDAVTYTRTAPADDGTGEGGTDGTTDGTTDAGTDGTTDGVTDGGTDGSTTGGTTDSGTDGGTDGGTDDGTDGGTDDTEEGTTRFLDIGLGNGDDTFTGVVDGAPADGDDLHVVVRGQNGMDTLGLTADGADVGADSSVWVELFGGNGRDDIELAFGGVVLGELKVTADGGNAKDTVSTEITAGAGSTGDVDAEVLGGHGKDNLTFSVTDDSGSEDETVTHSDWDLDLDGGLATDVIDASDLVDVKDGEAHD